MPTTAVYQPTTVTYEQQTNEARWNCPVSYFSRRVTNSLNRAVCFRIGLCLLGSTLFIIGVGLAAAGGAGGEAAELIAGGVLLCIGLLFIGVGGLAWRAVWAGAGAGGGTGGAGGGGAGGGGGLGHPNPSTDPLVLAQYAPVRDAPPDRDDAHLSEESQKMLERSALA